MSSRSDLHILDDGRHHLSVLTSGGTIVFLEGAAWDHTTISYAITPSSGVDRVVAAIVQRTIDNWNDAIKASGRQRLRDFRLMPTQESKRPDVEIRLRLDEEVMRGSTELTRESDGSVSHAVVTLTGQGPGTELNNGIMATIAVRQLGRALGLKFAATPEDPMYPAFNGIKLNPSTADVQALAAVEAWYMSGSPEFYPPRAIAK